MSIRKLELAMAYTRQSFIAKLRDDWLEGAFGEFMCRQVALRIGKPAENWTLESRRILQKVRVYLGPEVRVTVKDKTACLVEDMREARLGAYSRVAKAKNKVIDYYPELMSTIKPMDFDENEEFKRMVEEFIPEYATLLP